ncbi:MAG: bifunctional phosphopantothenoylcysteine decarboxylase/phosphopantothenate--cysteine ligase CoaBC [Acidimicrobiia bacterium]
MLQGRQIVLGVSGGVAAYKAAYLCRRLIEHGATVRVVMTESATRFVGGATFAALTGTQPVVGFFDEDDVSPHTSLARWADAVVVAPATAATIAKMATGDSSNVLIATVLATTSPVLVAPAMHTEMWDYPATVRNMETLVEFGFSVVWPDAGDLAGGDVGVGRLADPDAIAAATADLFGPRDLADTTVLVTAGGTREPIDPVRYIGNRSSGKMGNAIAIAAAERGAAVTLVTTAPAPSHPSIRTIPVNTADEMAAAVWDIEGGVDVAVMAAAVADFKPVDPSGDKLRRADGPPSIELEATPDVLMGVRERSLATTLVGFAAEAGSLEKAGEKAVRKGVDLLVANDIASAGSGFGSDTNEVTLIRSDGQATALPLMQKSAVADAILDAVVELRA